MLATRYPLFAPYLRRYFYSGWAFLMPYLFTYLLYYVTKWPVNATAVAGQGLEVIGGGPFTHHPSPIPCLLHVYWALHAIHAVLAGVALWSWLRAQSRGGKSDKLSAISNSPTAYPLPLTPYNSQYPLNLITRALPWALLALLFYIPGVYLEWPSDPWEHLRRINEWRILDTVGAHSSWMKSAYFIPYSLLSWCIGLRQLFWLDFYYTGICLLLCWQYYRFSRACGLGERASMVFVIIQALLFGNNIFSFYRYYGISSSIYAQLGAVALTRIVLEFAAKGTKLGTILQEETKRTEPKPELSPLPLLTPVQTDAENTNSQKIAKDTKSGNFVGPSLDDAPSAIPVGPHPACPAVVNPGLDARSDPKSEYHRTPFSHFNNHLSFWHLPSLTLLLFSSFALFILTAFNHPQGLGIAGLGIAAVIIWRLIEWKRSTLWWLISGTLIINALFLSLYHRPAIIETYRAQGWLNAWYGFNILDLTSPAGDRLLQIVSAFGLINIAAVACLYRSQPIGSLTLVPLFALSMPCIAIPFAALTNRTGGEMNIVTFQRFLFAIPIGLAFVSLGARLMREPVAGQIIDKRKTHGIIPLTTISYFALGGLMATPARNSFNRAWNTTVFVAEDLRLRDIFSQYETVRFSSLYTNDLMVVTIKAGTALLTYTSALVGADQSRKTGGSSIESASAVLDFLRVDQNINALQSKSGSLIAPTSHLSKHLIADPKPSTPSDWTLLGGCSPEFSNQVVAPNIPLAAIQNPAGSQCSPFTSATIPVQRTKSYRLEITVKQINSSTATAYLTVAWMDAQGKLLVSNVEQPLGAGKPRGWVNGTYSYFGLVDQAPPTFWSTYGISFGLCEMAEVPSNAYAIKIGALLNYKSTPSAIIQIAGVKLYETPPPTIGTAVPSVTSAYSPTSQAALLSTHWLPQQGIVDRGGTDEILTAAEKMRDFLGKKSQK